MRPGNSADTVGCRAGRTRVTFGSRRLGLGTRMDFRILGPLQVLDGERPLMLGGPKQRALLAVLILHANEAISTERLIDELWGERPPATAAKTVQVHVSRLRKALERSPENAAAGPVVTREHGYELQTDRESVD